LILHFGRGMGSDQVIHGRRSEVGDLE
jgi:hypothetical protein